MRIQKAIMKMSIRGRSADEVLLFLLQLCEEHNAEVQKEPGEVLLRGIMTVGNSPIALDCLSEK